MDKLKYIKLENEDGSYSSSIPLAVDSDYVNVNGSTLTNELNNKVNSATVNSIIDTLQNEITSLASGSPKGSYTTTSALIAANPDTGVYIVQENGHIYSWTKNGNEAIDLGIYQAIEVANDSVSQEKTTFIKTDNIGYFYRPAKIGYSLGGAGTSSNPYNINKGYNRYLSVVPVNASTNYSFFFKQFTESGTNYFKMQTFVETWDEIVTYLSTHVNLPASGAIKAVSALSNFTTGANDKTLIIQFSNDTPIDYYELYEGNNYTQSQYTNWKDCLDNLDFSVYNKKEIDEWNIPISLNMLKNEIKDNAYSFNLFDKNSYKNNKYIDASLNIVNNNGNFLSNIIKMKQGDFIFSEIWKDEITVSTHSWVRITKVEENGKLIENVDNVEWASAWTADEDCYIIITYQKQSAYTDIDYENYLCITLNINTYKYEPYKYYLRDDYNNKIENQLDDFSCYYNLFDKNNYKLDTSIFASGNIGTTNHFFVTNLMKSEIGDIFYLSYFNNDNNIQFTNVARYDNDFHYIGRLTSINTKAWTSDTDGYVAFICANPGDKTDLDEYLVISKNQQLTSYIPHKRYILPDTELTKDVSISKIDNLNYLISFGDFKVTLFKTVSDSTNAENWNLTTITDKFGNVLVPRGTDIIGPIKLRGNDDFIGGVHGDETTDYITVAINNHSYNLQDIINAYGETMTITFKSTCYDEQTKDPAFDRFVTITISKNKIHISNSFKALIECTLNSAPIGGLIACRNPIIKDIKFNTAYFSEAPTTSVNIASKYNTNATINTIYGSVTCNNIKGYASDNYSGYLSVFTNENPIRCKIYFMNYKASAYPIAIGDIISGEFEYTFS